MSVVVWSDFWRVCVVCFLYVLFCKYQRIFLKGNYFSVQDIIFSTNISKALKAIASRFLYIFLVAMLFTKLFNFSSPQVVNGIVLGSFLITWPSIYFYRLAFHRFNKVKRFYFWGCILSIAYSLAAVLLCIGTVIPAIFGEKEIYFASNSGLQVLLLVLGVIAPNPLNAILRNSISEPDIVDDYDTFTGDLSILTNRIRIEESIIDDLLPCIEESAHRSNIPVRLLWTVIAIEYVNRDLLVVRAVEWLICRFHPRLALKLNLSVGIAQISMRTAKQIIGKPVREYARQLLDDRYNIDVCAKYVSRLIKNHFADYENWFPVSEDEEHASSAYEYIAANYLTGSTTARQRFTKVYAEVLRRSAPELDSSFEVYNPAQ